MKVNTAQKLYKIMSAKVVTALVGMGVSVGLLAAGYLLALITLGTIATPGNPNQRPIPTPSLPVCYRLTDDSCTEGLWVNVQDAPTDKYAECLYWLTDIPTRIGRPGFAPEVCEEVGEQRG